MIGDYMVFGGIAIIAVGFLLLILALVLSLRGRGGQVKKGIIMMGPIPIIFADDPQTAKSLMVLALLLMAASIIVILLSMVH